MRSMNLVDSWVQTCSMFNQPSRCRSLIGLIYNPIKKNPTSIFEIRNSNSKAGEQEAMAMATMAYLTVIALSIAAVASDNPAATQYTNHTVGGVSRWFFNTTTNTSSTNYTYWAASQTFNLGAYLIFNTNTNQTVIQTTNDTTYQSCSMDDASDDTSQYGGGSNQFGQAMVIPMPLTSQGTNYFFSDADDTIQCQQGMAFQIFVNHGLGLPPSLNHCRRSSSTDFHTLVRRHPRQDLRSRIASLSMSLSRVCNGRHESLTTLEASKASDGGVFLCSAMADYSKDELLQLIKRFGAYLTVKMSNLFSISLANLDTQSIGALAGLAIAILLLSRTRALPSMADLSPPPAHHL